MCIISSDSSLRIETWVGAEFGAWQYQPRDDISGGSLEERDGRDGE